MKPIPLTCGQATPGGADGWWLRSGYRAADRGGGAGRMMLRSGGIKHDCLQFTDPPEAQAAAPTGG
jgi:hypothetical protein